MHNKIKLSKSDRAVKIVAYVLIIFFAVVCIYPLLLVLGVSFSDNTDVIRHGFKVIPEHFTTDTYLYLFARQGAHILESYGVTILTTVVGTLGAMLVTSMIAFAVSVKSLRYRNAISYICNFTIIFSAGLIPWYITCTQMLHLRNSLLALILPSMFSVFNMFLLRTYFSAVPESLYESAKIDGASWYRIYWSITLPLSKTAMLTVGMMYALNYWNDWWNALMFITKIEKRPLQFMLYQLLSNISAIQSGRVPSGAVAKIKLPTETAKMATTMITIGPIIFLYPFIQKYFVDGIMTGAVKE